MRRTRAATVALLGIAAVLAAEPAFALNVKCKSILNARTIARVCGAKLTRDKMETQNNYCTARFRVKNGSKTRSVDIAIHETKNAKAARGKFKVEWKKVQPWTSAKRRAQAAKKRDRYLDDLRAVRGIGREAYAYTTIWAGKQRVGYHITARSRRYWMSVTTDRQGNKQLPPCARDQLKTLTRGMIRRLPR